jgi:uncharacterized protein (TIGR00251 family)
MVTFDSKTIKIIVRTNAPLTELLEFDSARNAYRMNVHAQPEKGKANIEIIKYFKKEFKLTVEIISGMTSKEKLLRIA